MSKTMVTVTLRDPYLAECIRESARLLCRIPNRITSPPHRLVIKLEELAAKSIEIALTYDRDQPDIAENHWRVQFNLAVIRHLRTNGCDQLIARFCNLLDGSFPVISVATERIATEVKVVAVAAAETALMLAYDLDPRLLHWTKKDTEFARALAIAQRLGANAILFIERTDDSPSETA